MTRLYAAGKLSQFLERYFVPAQHSTGVRTLHWLKATSFASTR